MGRFLEDIYMCSSAISHFISLFSNSFWVYPILFFVFISVFFFVLTDNR